MGNASGSEGGRNYAVNSALFSQPKNAHWLLQELCLSPSSYFQLLPRDLHTKICFFVEAALFGAVITRPSLCCIKRISVPNTNDLIQKFFDDCEPYLKKVVHLLHNEEAQLSLSSKLPLGFISTTSPTDRRSSDLLGFISLREHPQSIAGIRAGYLAFTSYGFHVAAVGHCKVWIPWHVFKSGVEFCEPIEEVYHIDDAESPVVYQAVHYLPIVVRHSTTSATRYDTKHLVPFRWACSLDPIRKLRAHLCLMQTKIRALSSSQILRESPVAPTLHERLLMYWPARQQAYLHIQNALEYRLVTLFASVWFHPWIPFDLLRNTLREFMLSNDDGVWAICSNGSNTRESPDQRCSLMILSSKILWIVKGATKVKSLDFAMLAKCTITEVDGEVILFSHSSFQKTLHYRHQRTEKANGAYVPSGALQLLCLLQHLLMDF